MKPSPRALRSANASKAAFDGLIKTTRVRTRCTSDTIPTPAAGPFKLVQAASRTDDSGPNAEQTAAKGKIANKYTKKRSGR